eukprot:15461233-Alexandrium_andersonii.AAC.1
MACMPLHLHACTRTGVLSPSSPIARCTGACASEGLGKAFCVAEACATLCTSGTVYLHCPTSP